VYAVLCRALPLLVGPAHKNGSRTFSGSRTRAKGVRAF